MLNQTLTAARTPIGTLDWGIGVNWFDFFGAGGLYARCPDYPLDLDPFPADDDEHGWSLMMGEMTRLKPGCVRFGLPPDQILNADGSLNTHSKHFKHLDRVAAWCREHDSVLVLDTFLIPERYEFPNPPPPAYWGQMINMAAKDNHAYAHEFVAPLLNHIINDRGLTNVRYFNPVNEPINYGCYQTPPDGPDVYVHYVEMYAEIRQALDAIGLTEDRVGLFAIDTSNLFNTLIHDFAARNLHIDPYLAGYSVHVWQGRFDWDLETVNLGTHPLRTMIETFGSIMVRYAQACRKPLIAFEFGTFQYGLWEGDFAGRATPDATLLTAEIAIRLANIGFQGAMYWDVIDPNICDGWWSVFNMENGRVIRPLHIYPTYRMLMNYMPRGSAVYPLQPVEREYPAQRVFGTAIQAPNGERHLLLVNDHHTEVRNVTLNLPAEWAGLCLHRITKDRVRLGTAEQNAAVVSAEGQLVQKLMPFSLTVYTTGHAENMLPE